MIETTPNKKSTFQFHEEQAERIRRDTKRVELHGGPFDGHVARIRRYYQHYATTVPGFVAENWPPFEFDGLPEISPDVKYIAVYSNESDMNSTKDTEQFTFDEVRAYKQTQPHKNYPFGYERVHQAEK